MACNTHTKLLQRTCSLSLTAVAACLAVAAPVWSADAEINSAQQAHLSAEASHSSSLQSDSSAGPGVNLATSLVTADASASTTVDGNASASGNVAEPAEASGLEQPGNAIPDADLGAAAQSTAAATQQASAALGSVPDGNSAGQTLVESSGNLAGAVGSTISAVPKSPARPGSGENGDTDGSLPPVAVAVADVASELAATAGSSAVLEVADELNAAVETAVAGEVTSEVASSINAAIEGDIQNAIQEDLTADLISSLPLPGKN